MYSTFCLNLQRLFWLYGDVFFVESKSKSKLISVYIVAHPPLLNYAFICFLSPGLRLCLRFEIFFLRSCLVFGFVSLGSDCTMHEADIGSSCCNKSSDKWEV